MFETAKRDLEPDEKMNQKDQVHQIKTTLAKLYRSRCALCGCTKSRSGFTFHHIWYEKDEKTYKDFANSLAYYEYLAPLIRLKPHRFMYLCSDHHQALERACRYSTKTWKKLSRLRAKTIRCRT